MYDCRLMFVGVLLIVVYGLWFAALCGLHVVGNCVLLVALCRLLFLACLLFVVAHMRFFVRCAASY